MRDDHPQLYGRLLSASEQMSGAGCAMFLFSLAAMISLCVAIHLQWLELIGINAEMVRSIWFYIALLTNGAMAFGWFVGVSERRAYRRARAGIVNAAREAGYDRYTLLAEIEGEENLSDVAKAIKKDSHFDVDRELY